jgi:hypothetical protein
MTKGLMNMQNNSFGRISKLAMNTLVLSQLFLGCGAPPSPSVTQESFGPRLNMAAGLGMGYDSLRGSLTGNYCVLSDTQSSIVSQPQDRRLPFVDAAESIRNPKQHSFVNSEGELRFERNLSSSDLQKAITGQAELIVRVHPLVALRGEVGYSQSSGASSLDDTITVTAKIQYRTSFLGSVDISESIYQRMNRRRPNIPENQRPLAREICGDEFVERVDEGALVSATLSMKFASMEDKEQWQGEIGLQLAEIVNIRAGGFDLSKFRGADRTHVQFNIIQKGGNPVDILKLLPDADIEKNTGTASISCGIRNPQSCYKAYQDALEYISKISLKDPAGNESWFPLTFTTKDYRTAPGLVSISPDRSEPEQEFYQTKSQYISELRAGYDDVSIDVEQLRFDRNQLVTRLEESLELEKKLSALTSRGMNSFDSVFQLAITEFESALQHNRNRLEISYQECFTHPQRCHESTQSALKSLIKVNQSILYIAPMNFVTWCQNYRRSIGRPTDLLTVRGMIEYASTAFQIDPNDCDKLSLFMDTTSHITILPGSAISSLLPLQSVPNLRTLNLRGNLVEDLSQLATLPGLEVVDLSHNMIHDLTPLQYTPSSLKIVNLNANGRSITTSRTLPSRLDQPLIGLRRQVPLEELFLQDNMIPEISNCETLSRYIFTAGNPVGHATNCSNCDDRIENEFQFPR